MKASFRTSESASISAEASAYFPVDLFGFAGVIATLKAQAEAKASVGLDVSLQPAALLDAVLAEHADNLWLPYVEVVARQFSARAGVQASAAVCVKATAETKIGLRLFPAGNDRAGTVFVINYATGSFTATAGA